MSWARSHFFSFLIFSPSHIHFILFLDLWQLAVAHQLMLRPNWFRWVHKESIVFVVGRWSECNVGMDFRARPTWATRLISGRWAFFFTHFCAVLFHLKMTTCSHSTGRLRSVFFLPLFNYHFIVSCTSDYRIYQSSSFLECSGEDRIVSFEKM